MADTDRNRDSQHGSTPGHEGMKGSQAGSQGARTDRGNGGDEGIGSSATKQEAERIAKEGAGNLGGTQNAGGKTGSTPDRGTAGGSGGYGGSSGMGAKPDADTKDRTSR